VLGACRRIALAASNSAIPFYDRLSPVYLATMWASTPVPASCIAPRPMARTTSRFLQAAGMKNDEILNPVQGNGVYADLPFFGGQHLESQSADRREAGRSRRAARARDQPQLHALLAPQDAGDLPRHRAVVRRHGSSAEQGQTSCASAPLAAIEATEFFPAWGKARLHAMIANRPDWCISRQRNWGVPIPFFLHKETGEAHPRTLELMEEVAKRVEQGGIEAWFKLDAKPSCSATRPRSTTRSATRWTCGSIPAPRTGT
jgi:isoleucyl-tRNA synthetase